MSAVLAAVPAAKTKTSVFRRPLLVLGLAGLTLYAADTLAAANYAYLPFDVPVERFIQSLNWGPLVQAFTFLDWIEGTRQQILGIAGIVLIAAVNWRAVPLVVMAALSGGIYTLTAMVIQRPRPPEELVNVADDPAYAETRAALTCQLAELQRHYADTPYAGPSTPHPTWPWS